MIRSANPLCTPIPLGLCTMGTSLHRPLKIPRSSALSARSAPAVTAVSSGGGVGWLGSGWGASRGMLAAGRGRAQGRQAVSGRHHADHWDWADG